MAQTQEKNALEDARARLERALSTLTQEVAESRNALAESRTAQEKTIQEMSAQADRMQSLEQENHRLHEQIAALSLQEPQADDSEGTAALEAEKNALQQNYDLLKRQYTSLQDEFEGLQNQVGRDSEANGAGDDTALKQQVDMLLRERSELRTELDSVIAELETYLTETRSAAGGIN